MSMLQRYGTPLAEVAVIEQDRSDDVMVTWGYPGVSEKLEPILLSRCLLGLGRTPLAFTFSKYENSWIYIHTRALGGDEEEDGEKREGALAKVKTFSICLICKEFNPERYAALSKLFGNVYEKTSTPLTVLQGFLKVLTTGGVGEYDPDDYPAKDAFLATSIKDIIRTFGIEIILLWTALMMKKRVVVYCDKLTTLLRCVRCFPLFVWHRKDFDVLRPFVNMTPEEIEDLESAKVYVAGFTDPAIKGRSDLYDLYIDVSERSITVADHAKGDFRLGAFHKELGETLVESAEDPEVSALEILKDLTLRTKEFLAKLHSLQVEDEQGNKAITLESLQQRQLPGNMGQFLFAVASAEGLTKQ